MRQIPRFGLETNLEGIDEILQTALNVLHRSLAIVRRFPLKTDLPPPPTSTFP